MFPTYPLLKVVIAGNGNVGKTSLVRRYCEGRFETSRIMTIGVDFHTKVVDIDDVKVKLSIWDVAGQERFAMVRDAFYRGALAAVLAFSLVDTQSLADLPRWKDEIIRRAPNIRFLVAATKLDLMESLDPQTGEVFAQSIGADFIHTSASTGQGVEEMFQRLARLAFGH